MTKFIPLLCLLLAGCISQKQYGFRVDFLNVCDHPVQVTARPLDRLGFGYPNQSLLPGRAIRVFVLKSNRDSLGNDIWDDYGMEISFGNNRRAFNKTQFQDELKLAKYTKKLCGIAGDDCRVHLWVIDSPFLCLGNKDNRENAAGD
jgi:hypothetical protein